MNFSSRNPALILIDIQQAFNDEDYWGGNRNNPQAEANAKDLLHHWRENKLPLYHVRHSSQNPNSLLHISKPGFAFKPEVEPLEGEPIITKDVNSAFIGTNLKQQLDEEGINTLVILGLTTNHCVSTTTRMAGNYGFDTYLVSDATATFDRTGIKGEHFDSETIHLTSLASLKDEFAKIVTTKDILRFFTTENI